MSDEPEQTQPIDPPPDDDEAGGKGGGDGKSKALGMSGLGDYGRPSANELTDN